MKLSQKLGKLIVDQNAETMGELAKSTLLSREALTKLKADGLKNGTWEEVWKKHGGRMVKAWREKK